MAKMPKIDVFMTFFNKTGKILNLEQNYIDMSLIKKDYIKFVPYNAVKSYRNYYVKRKSHFAKWEPKTNTPEWYTKLLKEIC